jgi:hypothetical protein
MSYDNCETLYNMPQDNEEEENTNLPTNQPSDEDTAMFKDQVAEWLKLDEQIRKLNIAVRERKTHQKALASKVQSFMITYGYDNLNTNQGVIKSNVRTVKQPLKLVDIRTKLSSLDVNPELKSVLDQEMKAIFEGDRPTVVKQSLHRRLPKVSMSLEI